MYKHLLKSLLSIPSCVSPEVDLLGYVVILLNFLGSAIVSAPFKIPTNSAQGSTFTTKDTAFDHPRLTFIIPLNFTNSAIKLSHIPA